MNRFTQKRTAASPFNPSIPLPEGAHIGLARYLEDIGHELGNLADGLQNGAPVAQIAEVLEMLGERVHATGKSYWPDFGAYNEGGPAEYSVEAAATISGLPEFAIRRLLANGAIKATRNKDNEPFFGEATVKQLRARRKR